MEKSMGKSDVYPLRSELRAHKLSAILVLAFIALAAFLNVAAHGAVSGDPTDTPVFAIFAVVIVIVSGLIVAGEAYVDTFKVAARDAQHAIPVSARRRYLTKLWSVILRHIVPILLANAAFIAAYAAAGAFSGKEIVDIAGSVEQTYALICYALMADSMAVLTLVCTGTRIAQVLFGFVFCFVAATYWANAVILNSVERIFGGSGSYDGLLLMIFWCVIAAMAFFVAGTIYVRRDGRHTGKHVAGPAAWEMVAAAAILLAQILYGSGEKTWLVLIVLFAVFLVLHVVIFRSKARRELPRAIAIYIAVTVIFLSFILFLYMDTRNEFFSNDRNALESGEYVVAKEEWDDNWWLKWHRYASEPYCELMIGPRILKWIDSTKLSDEYCICNADGSVLNEEQYGKLVDVLRDFCSNNEIRKDTFGDVMAYLFCGGRSKYEKTDLGFQVTISYGEGRNAHRERCSGYIMYEERVPDFLKRIEEAGFVVQ